MAAQAYYRFLPNIYEGCWRRWRTCRWTSACSSTACDRSCQVWSGTSLCSCRRSGCQVRLKEVNICLNIVSCMQKNTKIIMEVLYRVHAPSFVSTSFFWGVSFKSKHFSKKFRRSSLFWWEKMYLECSKKLKKNINLNKIQPDFLSKQLSNMDKTFCVGWPGMPPLKASIIQTFRWRR